MTLSLSSPAFSHNSNIPKKYTCDGENISPPLEISGAPKGTKSLVLIMEDPDVPKNIREDGMWDHWIVWNIPADAAEIKENSIPGITGVNTSGENKYGGPCPPDRQHRYFFKLYALYDKLNLPESATKADVLEAMWGKVIERAELIGRYKRD